MLIKALFCGFLLHGLLLPVYALTQSFATPGSGATPGFDYDVALAQSQAAIGREMGEVRFTAADGRSVKLSDLRGKPLVLSMVYTSCYQICPMTTRYLSQVVDKARDALGEDSFAVAVVGFDVALDTPAAMRYFANKQGIADDGWNLLSVDRNDVERLADDLGFLYTPSANGYDHLIQATIIDSNGRVYRQVYGQVFDTPLLVDPLIDLVLGRSSPEQPILASLVSKIKLFCTTYDPARDGYYFDYSLFIGMLIGGSIIVFTSVVVVRGWRNGPS
jgi:protein SCO1/2